jgi:predicted amidohydrolase
VPAIFLEKEFSFPFTILAKTIEEDMKLGLVQYSPEWENVTKNISKIEELLNDTDKDFDLLIFPEMTLTGFTMNCEKFAEEIDGIGTQLFMHISSALKTNIFAGIIEQDTNRFYNTLVHFDNNGLIKARYRKIHPYSYGNENKHYTGSDEIVITDIDHINFGLSVCYDLRFPELYRFYVKEKVDACVNIASWPIPRIEHWKALLKARAIENQCFVIGVNRVGDDPYNKYNGCSAVFDPMGNNLVMVENDEKIISCEIDINLVKETRDKLPFLQDIKLI